MAAESKIEAHWTRGGLADAVMQAFADAGLDLDALTADAISPLDHLHGRGVEATRELMARLAPEPHHHLLDIGSGLGGPARFAAAEYGCRVTGVDLTEEFCAVAKLLTEMTGLADRVEIRRASALDLPFADAAFDGAYSQNVSMNIADKAGFYAEAARVLKPGAPFAASECLRGPGGAPHFPVPWAEVPENSHLLDEAETRELLEAAGLQVIELVDVTEILIAHHEEQRRHVAEHGPPVLGAHVVIGPSAKEKMRNSARSVAEGRVVPVEIFARRR